MGFRYKHKYALIGNRIECIDYPVFFHQEIVRYVQNSATPVNGYPHLRDSAV